MVNTNDTMSRMRTCAASFAAAFSRAADAVAGPLGAPADSGRGTVARLLDCRADRGECGGISVVFHLHRVLQQVHHSVLDTGNARCRLLDAGGAGSTRHARNVEGLFLGHLLPRELLNELHRLVDDGGVTRLDLLDDAGFQVVLQKDGGNGVHGGLRGGELR